MKLDFSLSTSPQQVFRVSSETCDSLNPMISSTRSSSVLKGNTSLETVLTERPSYMALESMTAIATLSNLSACLVIIKHGSSYNIGVPANNLTSGITSSD